MSSFNEIKEKIECFMGERHSIPAPNEKIWGYYRTINTKDYSLYECPRGKSKVIAAYGTMTLIQCHRNKNLLTFYPYYQNKYIRYKIVLSEKFFPSLIPGSNVLMCMFLPYMRVVGENKYLKSVRLVIITDKAQIYHNYPSRNKESEGFSLPGDITRFEESVIWDMPGRKYPVNQFPESKVERYFPNLPETCYQYHPLLNTDLLFRDQYGNGGFGKQTLVDFNGEKCEVSRFYIHNRSAESNPFHFIGTGEKEFKMSLLATYRSNVDAGVRTCVFASGDGGRQWYCKYEFADLGEYEFRQGNATAFGKNFGNPILNTGYGKSYIGGLLIKKRQLVTPSSHNKEPVSKFQWPLVGEVETIEENLHVTLKTIEPHGLYTGNIVALTGHLPENSKMAWMLNSMVTPYDAGNGLLFKVEVIDEYRILLYELVSSPDNNIPCRHVHHINRIKDGWILGTGEIYPNGWLFYIQMKEADTFSVVEASSEFKIVRLNSTQESIQRTMGLLLKDDETSSLIFASDHDYLSRQKCILSDKRTVGFSRSSTGVFTGKLCDIDDRTQYHAIFEAREPCFYFQELDSLLIFCGQRGELGISFDFGKSWKRERVKEPIIHYYGSNGQLYYFDNCILFRK